MGKNSLLHYAQHLFVVLNNSQAPCNSDVTSKQTFPPKPTSAQEQPKSANGLSQYGRHGKPYTNPW